VTGMTCGHCASAVTTELSALPGVEQVDVDLVAGGVSNVTVTSAEPLSREQVEGALDEAGDYHLAADPA
ncbi:MAG: heavy-metal-associated domain-containing protein, partial [Angustibacter sp.]